MIDFLNKEVQKKKTDWRKDLIKAMTSILREHFDDETLEASLIRRVIRSTVNSISIPNFKYELQMPKSLSPQGVLEGDKAEAFRDDAEIYFNSLYNKFYKEIGMYTKALTAEMRKIRLEERLLEESKKELTTLDKLIENKEMELKRISYLKGELKKIEVDQ